MSRCDLVERSSSGHGEDGVKWRRALGATSQDTVGRSRVGGQRGGIGRIGIEHGREGTDTIGKVETPYLTHGNR